MAETGPMVEPHPTMLELLREVRTEVGVLRGAVTELNTETARTGETVKHIREALGKLEGTADRLTALETQQKESKERTTGNRWLIGIVGTVLALSWAVGTYLVSHIQWK